MEASAGPRLKMLVTADIYLRFSKPQREYLCVNGAVSIHQGYAD